MYVTDISKWKRSVAHGEFFKAIRPATTIEVSRLIDPAFVEIEATAIVFDTKKRDRFETVSFNMFPLSRAIICHTSPARPSYRLEVLRLGESQFPGACACLPSPGCRSCNKTISSLCLSGPPASSTCIALICPKGTSTPPMLNSSCSCGSYEGFRRYQGVVSSSSLCDISKCWSLFYKIKNIHPQRVCEPEYRPARRAVAESQRSTLSRG